MRVFLALGQSGVSNFPSLERKLRKNAPCLNQLAISNFFKSDDGHAISRQEKRRLPKSTARFPAKKKMAFSIPVGLSWDSPPPPTESVRTDGRTYGRTDVRTDGHVTITSQPKFLGLIGYQEGVMNLGLGTSAGIGERKSEVSGHCDVTNKSVREIQRKVNKFYSASCDYIYKTLLSI